MKRRDRAVLSGAFATGASRLITAATSFVTLGIAAHVLTPAEFGLVAVLISLWLILTMFDLGVAGALTTRVARSHARDDLTKIRVHFTSAALAMSVIGGLIAIAGTISAVTMPWHGWIGGNLPPSTVVRSLIIAFVVAGASLPANVGLATLAGMQRFTAAKACAAASGVLTVVATAAVAPLKPPPEVFVFVTLGCPLLVTLVFTAWVRFGILGADMTTAGFEAAQFKNMLLSSGWYGLYSAANTVSIGSGTIIVGAVLGPADAGVFSVASRLFSPIVTVVAASGALLWPGMTEAISRGDVGWARSRYRRGLLIVAAISAALSTTLIVIGPWLAEVWVGQALVPPRSLFVWTAALTMTAVVASQASVLLMAVERLRVAASVSVCAAGVSVGISVPLCGAVGLNGAAIGTLAGCLGVLLPSIALLARDAFRALGPAGDRHSLDPPAVK